MALVVPRLSACSPWKPAFLPSPPPAHFLSLASYSEGEKEDDAEAGNTLTPHSHRECFHRQDPEGHLADQSTVGTDLSEEFI